MLTMRHEIRITWAHLTVFAVLLVSALSFVYAQVDKNAAWHSSTEVRVFIKGYGHMSLQQAIDNEVITAGRALEADRAIKADFAEDADYVDNQKAQTIIDACTHRVCISGVCMRVSGAGADQCTTNADCGIPSGPSGPGDPMP
jgi:hypothetical protein